LSAIAVILLRNPIHSILCLILVFFNSAVLLMLLQVEFLGLMFLIIYVGAIAVLFLFVVMMLNIKLIELTEVFFRYMPLAGILAFLFLCEIFLLLRNKLTFVDFYQYTPGGYLNKIFELTNLEVIGSVLYTYYFYFFIIAGLILLVAILGALTLTLHERKSSRKQDTALQVAKSINESINVVKSLNK
jgi:NADH-quinone oxidoreductase subunit J